jgi:capsular exopolysaccharide synthesis family protein
MNRIFDASQRSEAECTRTDSARLSGETQMPELAERRPAAQQEIPVVSEQARVPKAEDHSAPLGFPGAPQVQTRAAASAAAEYSQGEEILEPFDHFQSLRVELTSQSRLVSLTDKGSPAAEAFRLLAVRLRHLRRDRPLKKVLITSTIPQEGKSTVAANLACTLALRTRQRVLVLEGDLRRPSLSQLFGLGRNPGICEWLESDNSLWASVYHLEAPNIWILPAGSSPSNALELLQSGKLSMLLDQLNALFDWIIIDSPPVLPFADTSVWMRIADGILLTTRQGTTEKRQLRRGLEAIESKKLIGALVNSSKQAAAIDYDYYYGPAAVSGADDASHR